MSGFQIGPGRITPFIKVIILICTGMFLAQWAMGRGLTEALGLTPEGTAERFIGVPYRWGGESTVDGFDCSGLTMVVYQLNGLDLPRTSAEQWRAGRPVDRDEMNRGDLVFFATRGGRVSHVGIYLGGDTFLHAPSRGNPIQTASLSSDYYRARYVGARAYFCGHAHCYTRAVIKDRAGREIRQIIAGTGGGPLKAWAGAYGDKRVTGEFHDEKHRGYLLATVDGPAVTIAWKAMIEEGGTTIWKTLDVFRYSLRPES